MSLKMQGKRVLCLIGARAAGIWLGEAIAIMDLPITAGWREFGVREQDPGPQQRLQMLSAANS